MLVSVSDGTSDGHSAPVVPIQVVADIPVGGINRLAALRSCLEERGFPQRVIELILEATRSNTHAAYQSTWVTWSSWCIQRGHNPLSSGVKEVLDFLSDYFHSGKSYSSVNIARSMLSL